MELELNIWNSTVIVVVFSFVVVAMDEYLVKPFRLRHWKQLAESGDEEKAELLRLAQSANVVDE